MTRGNQREIDRERAKKRQEAYAPSGKKGDFIKRREMDAEIMRKKQEGAMRKKQQEGQPDEEYKMARKK